MSILNIFKGKAVPQPLAKHELDQLVGLPITCRIPSRNDRIFEGKLFGNEDNPTVYLFLTHAENNPQHALVIFSDIVAAEVRAAQAEVKSVGRLRKEGATYVLSSESGATLTESMIPRFHADYAAYYELLHGKP